MPQSLAIPQPSAQPALLSIAGLSVSYGQFRAIHSVDVVVGAGEIVSIIGANGSGKSTLLKAIVGQAERVEGNIEFAGETIVGRSTASIVARGVALVPEGRRLFPSLTVEENLWLGWNVGRRGAFGFAEFWQLFPQLAGRRRQRAGSLSGGQQQMVALGRALLTNPRLLLCDEISLGLAPILVDELYALLPRIKESGVGIVVVEQDISRSLAIADRFYCLLEGRIVLSGRPGEVGREAVIQHYFGL
jgi:branched-chain amino acid transport system ATP-binding protein